MEKLMLRKIGAFELVVLLMALEFIFGSGLRVFILLLGAVGFYFAKKHFGGEFSLAQLRGLFDDPKKEKPTT